jgi:hypothetical protein
LEKTVLAAGRGLGVTNAFTVDVEDWFCVHNFTKLFPIEIWGEQELRVEANTRRILALLANHNV